MEQTHHKKLFKTCLCTIIFVILCTITALAGTWETIETGGHKYKDDDETYLINTWLQENGKWYFFDADGLLVINNTIEGYQVGADGAEQSGTVTITSQYPQVVISATVSVPEETASTLTYVLNKNSKKFHKPTCSSVDDMAAKNRVDAGSGREEIINQGYVPCKRCNP